MHPIKGCGRSRSWLGLQNARDRKIFAAARNANAIVMTKDADSVCMVEQFGVPPKVILLTCVNTSNTQLKGILKLHCIGFGYQELLGLNIMTSASRFSSRRDADWKRLSGRGIHGYVDDGARSLAAEMKNCNSKGSIFYGNIGILEEDHAAKVGGRKVARYPAVQDRRG